VTCWDGTEIGESLPIEYGCEGADADFDAWLEDLYSHVADAASDMMDGCPDCETPVA
jgi:hypothetical protein